MKLSPLFDGLELHGFPANGHIVYIEGRPVLST
jgi:hypothetical protein